MKHVVRCQVRDLERILNEDYAEGDVQAIDVHGRYAVVVVEDDAAYDPVVTHLAEISHNLEQVGEESHA